MNDVVARSRRDDSQLCLQRAKTTLMSKSVCCMAPKIFNKLPKSWRDLSMSILKNKLRKLLVDKAYYNVADFLMDNGIE